MVRKWDLGPERIIESVFQNQDETYNYKDREEFMRENFLLIRECTSMTGKYNGRHDVQNQYNATSLDGKFKWDFTSLAGDSNFCQIDFF